MPNIQKCTSKEMRKVIFIGKQMLYIVDGQLYSGKITFENINAVNSIEDYQQASSARKDIFCQTIELKVHAKRIPIVNGVMDIICDPDGVSFVVLQKHSKRYLDIPQLNDYDLSFKSLMIQADESDDIHDIVFHVTIFLYKRIQFIILI